MELLLVLDYNIYLEIITCDPSIYSMDHPDLSFFMEYSIGLKRVKCEERLHQSRKG